MNAQELQSLRNLGNECEEAADEIERLRAQQAMLMAAHEFVKQERDALRDAQRQAVRLLDKPQSSKQVTGYECVHCGAAYRPTDEQCPRCKAYEARRVTK